MQNTPTGCGSELLTILRILENDRTSRSVNNVFECSDLGPNSITFVCASQSSAQVWNVLCTERLMMGSSSEGRQQPL